MTPPEWTTALPDWEDRIVRGQSIIPVGALFPQSASEAMDVFDHLTLMDAPSGPEKMGTLCRPWVKEIAAALFGSLDPETKRRHITQYFLTVSKKNGKALALDTPIPTPDGWKMMGEIQEGDTVFGQDGKPTRVIATSEVFTDHKCYRVSFSNGETVVADAGHLWVTDALQGEPGVGQGNHGKRPAALRPGIAVRTTEQIANSVCRPDGARNHSISLAKPIECPPVELPIAPYTLGAWLGDGHSNAPKITSMDDEIIEAVRADGYVIEYRSNNGSKANTYAFPPRDGLTCPRGHDLTERRKVRGGKPQSCLECARGWDKHHRYGTPMPPIVARSFHEALREAGVLNNKHIPDVYFRASREQRLALLQGLMDTDGTINKNGRCISFLGCNERLVLDFRKLLSTLGVKSTLISKPAKLNGRVVGTAHRVQFNVFREDLPVFRLTRKLARMNTRDSLTMRARSDTVQITECVEVPSVPVKCICVANEDKMFLFGETMLPTHNSSLASAVMLTALIVNHRPSAEFLILAPTKEIAEAAYKPIRDMIKIEPELSDRFHEQWHYKTVTDRLNGSVLKVVAADSATVTGKKATGVFIDELHEFGKSPKAAHMLTEATGGLASRPEGFVFYCTTQSSEPPAGVFADKLAYARAVRDGEIEDKRFLPIIYEFPESWIKEGKHRDLDNAYVTNPNWGLSVDADFLRQKMQEAQQTGEHAVKDVLSKHMNVQTSMSLRSDRWAGADFWEDAGDPAVTLDALLQRCEVAVIGIDGGGLDDLLGLAVIGRETGTRQWLHWGHAWAHKIALERRKEIAPRLRDFEREGTLTIVDRPGDDVAQIVEYIVKVRDAGILPGKDSIGVDAAGIGSIVEALTAPEYGFTMEQIVGVSQGWRLNGAIKNLERMVAGGEFWHGGTALMAWSVGNAKTVAVGNAVTINKQVSGSAKIDPLMATFDAVYLMALNPEPCRKKLVLAVAGR